VKKYYKLKYTMAQTVKWPDVVFFHNAPGEEVTVGWIGPPLPGASQNFEGLYGALTGTPIGGPSGTPEFPVVDIAHNGVIPIWDVEPDLRWGEAELTNFSLGGMQEDQIWGLQSGFLTPQGPFYGQPSHAVQGPVDIASELWAIESVPFDNTYYTYDSPSSVAITGFNGKLTVSTRIAGAICGPYRIGNSNWFAAVANAPGNISSEFPGYTVLPHLTVEAPKRDPSQDIGEGNPEEGGAARPYLTTDEWHHLLVCVDLKGDSMVEDTFIPSAPPEAKYKVPIYRSCVMWVLLDGVKYGGDPWPADVEPPGLYGGSRPSPDSDIKAARESPQQDYQFPPSSGAVLPLQDTSFDSRHGIMVKNQPFSIPYHDKWKRITSDEYIEEEMFKGTRPFHYGWQGGDPDKATVVGGTNDFTDPVPAAQLDFPRSGDGNSEPPPRTEDIKRYYSDVQVWFGKYIDPTDYENLKLFLDLSRDDEGNLIGNIPALDEEDLAAYAAAQANDPSVKILSKAAAPNNLGEPDVYLAGGASSFIHDRGKEGDVMVKTGTINNTPKPVDIPIPESAVKPLGL